MTTFHFRVIRKRICKFSFRGITVLTKGILNIFVNDKIPWSAQKPEWVFTATIVMVCETCLYHPILQLSSPETKSTNMFVRTQEEKIKHVLDHYFWFKTHSTIFTTSFAFLWPSIWGFTRYKVTIKSSRPLRSFKE